MLARLRLQSVFNQLSRSAMSTTAHNTNTACCTIPPVHSDYQPKGTFQSLLNFDRVYVTGPESSKNALVCVYDIFGFFPQTQQGADILASTLGTRVYMPDFFAPDKPFPIDRFPPSTKEDSQKLQEFFGTVASPPANIKKLVAFGDALRLQGQKKVGVYGMCWGGKVTVVSSGENTPFDAAAIVHPAMLSVNDVQKLKVPFAIYISKDEPVDKYNEIVEIISKNSFASFNDHKSYSNMHHGWAAARGDLKNEENKKAYEDVYERLATFFKKALT